MAHQNRVREQSRIGAHRVGHEDVRIRSEIRPIRRTPLRVEGAKARFDVCLLAVRRRTIPARGGGTPTQRTGNVRQSEGQPCGPAHRDNSKHQANVTRARNVQPSGGEVKPSGTFLPVKPRCLPSRKRTRRTPRGRQQPIAPIGREIWSMLDHPFCLIRSGNPLWHTHLKIAEPLARRAAFAELTLNGRARPERSPPVRASRSTRQRRSR